MTDHHPPLNYENSLTATNSQISTTLPPEVSQCLKNARFLHLATISSTGSGQPTPHVSLMNYTFLPNYTTRGPVIIMTTNAQSLKTQNLISNPRVSLLVHDWVSHRPPTVSSGAAGGTGRSGSPPGAATTSSLASLLLNLNTAALSSISTTIAGEATILEAGSEEEKWCKEAHLQNNTFEGQLSTEAGYFGGAVGGRDGQLPQRGNTNAAASGYIEGDDVRVVMVPVRSGRISDFKGGVRDWQVIDDEEYDEAAATINDAGDIRGRNTAPVNGVIH